MRARNLKSLFYTFSVCFGAIIILTTTTSIFGTEAAPEGGISRRPSTYVISHPEISIRSFITVRGGFSDDGTEGYVDDYDGEDDSTDELEETADGENALVFVSKRVVITLGRAAFATVAALKRAIVAGFQGGEDDVEEDNDDSEEPSTLSKAMKVVKRMWRAALTSPGSQSKDDRSRSSTPVKKQEKERRKEAKKPKVTDFGYYLANAYKVNVDQGDDEFNSSVLGGTFGDALREARSRARLLVAFIPASQPGHGKKTATDQLAIRSILSKEVSEAVEKRAKKKVDSGSFIIWGAKAGSPEAVTAIKRLRAKQLGSKGGKRPMLLVAYPAQVSDTTGMPKLVPRLVAQHHCNPPPSSESMAAWLNALRKRHAKQYSSMQHDLKEMELYKERQEGYRSSIVSDVQRQEQEKKEEEERLAAEAAEKERLMELERRREDLKASLPEEPGKEVSNAMTIALRFADGRTGQRRFGVDTQIAAVFNWVDAIYEMERETVILTTMNGQKTFSWKESGMALGETGLGRMTGLRVTQQKMDEEAKDEIGGQHAVR